MSDRHALLIGVSEYDGDLFERLTGTVNADIERMSEALRESDYTVQYCVPSRSDGWQPNRGAIQQALRRACLEAPADSVLLIYYSGHGIVIDGQSYLVPKDVVADLDDGTLPDPDSLIPLVPRAVERCQARLIVLVVDACRDDPSGRSAPELRGSRLYCPPNGAFGLLTSCRQGQTSGYDETGSFFTQSLSEVLARRNPAQTLDEVVEETGQRMARRLAHTDAPEQTPHLAWATDRSAGAETICEGDQISAAWERAVKFSPLWSRAGCGEDLVERTRDAVLKVVESCARDWLAAEAVLKEQAGLADPWASYTYPARVLAVLDRCLSPDVRLSAQELGMLVAAPFLREATMAEGIRDAAGLQPTNFERLFNEGLRDDLELTFAMYDHVCRRAEGLERRGRLEPRDALAMWLVHRWLVARPRLWEGPAAHQVSQRLANALGAAGCTGRLTAEELAGVARVLMHSVGADADDKRLTERITGSDFTDTTRAVTALLAVAGIMAADTRRMPTVVVDHLGITDELQISALQRAVDLLTWEAGAEGTWCLTATCDHAAIHKALDHVAAEAEHTRKGFRSLGGMAPALFEALPSSLSAEGLRAVSPEGRPVYKTPLLAFRLSDEKIRELLMGRQLYGDPSLAIRELYQNALDACRYRRARRRYRELRGLQLAPWDGRITFRQGTDSSGRGYIECRDNGIGMTVEALKNTFANAGERFVYRQDFRYEQARWQELDSSLRLIPNSQFGIGVFSYFMIAEEIEIITRPVDEDDQIGRQAHRIRIASSGSLFQITTAASSEPAGGTCVRLFLTGDDQVSMLRTLRRLLWLSEFHVEATEDEVGQETWLPETLRHTGGTAAPLQYGDDLWWVPGEGGIAADGIRTNEETYGLVVNLRGQNRPRFSVDRNTLQYWKKEWVADQIEESLPSLLNWPQFSLSWLWKVTESSPKIARQIFDHIVDKGMEIPVGGSWGWDELAQVRDIGCLPIDQMILSERNSWWYGTRNLWIRSWRTGVWVKNGTVENQGNLPVPQSLDGFPAVEPGDAHFLRGVYTDGSYGAMALLGRPPTEVLLRIKCPKSEVPPSNLHRLRRFAIAGLDVSCLRSVPLPERSLDEEEVPLQWALAAWGGSGDGYEPRCLGGSLARVSAHLNIPLGELLQRVNSLIPGAVDELNRDLETLREHVFTDLEVKLFSADLDGQAPWIRRLVTPAHIAKASSTLDLPVSTILEMFDRFGPLGYEVAGRDRYPADLTSIEVDALQALTEVDQILTPIEFFAMAVRLEKPVHELAHELARVAAAGFFELPDLSGVPGGPATEVEAELISRIGVRLRIEGRSRFGQWAVVKEVLERVGLKSHSGYERHLSELQRCIRLAALRRPVTIPELIHLAHELRCDLRVAIDHYAEVFSDSADLSLVTSRVRYSDIRDQRYMDVTALIGDYFDLQTDQGPIEWKLGPWRILYACAVSRLSVQEFLERLGEYREIGAPVPELSGSVMASYRDFIPDSHDLAMTSVVDDHGDSLPLERVDALHLVKTAGRFGWTLAYAHERFARIEPLGLVLDYPKDACVDELVHWQDLLVITDFLDGQPPVVSGVVGPDHIAAAAGDVEESEEQVVGRLRKYQPLFGYRLEGETDER
ncbi:HD domain-containing protein [Actinomadura luteofluorescens]|uniref:HD domain-containing protein n=1 Tax=Actinomadura luteofluorescens TaxID=46163 RepID=UPI003D8BEAEF